MRICDQRFSENETEDGRECKWTEGWKIQCGLLAVQGTDTDTDTESEEAREGFCSGPRRRLSTCDGEFLGRVGLRYGF